MIDLKECVIWLKAGLFEKVCLQIPEYLMIHSATISRYLQKHVNTSIFVIGSTAYEYCCNDKLNVDHIQADALIHIGHACLDCSNDLPTFYIFEKQKIDENIFFEKFNQHFPEREKKLLLFYDTAFAYSVGLIYEQLRLKYMNIVISILNCSSNVSFTKVATSDYHTMILGRYFILPENDLLECYDAVFLGSNYKTFITLSMSIPVTTWYHFDGFIFLKHDTSTSPWFKKRYYTIERIRDAKNFGIIVASLNIKEYLEIIKMLKWILKIMNKKIYLFSIGKMNPTKLANFQDILKMIFNPINVINMLLITFQGLKLDNTPITQQEIDLKNSIEIKLFIAIEEFKNVDIIEKETLAFKEPYKDVKMKIVEDNDQIWSIDEDIQECTSDVEELNHDYK